MAKAKKAKKSASSVSTPAVQQAAAAAPAAAVSQTAAAVASGVTPAASKNKGRTTGMRVMQYQDKLLADNMKAKLTDRQLLDKMREEFPKATGKIFAADIETRLAILRIVRRLFNEKRHGSQIIDPPAGGVPEFDENGKALAEQPVRRRRGAVPAAAATDGLAKSA